MDYEGILKRLDEVMPLAKKIGLLRLEGKSDREIAKELGISRTSMYRMLDKAKAILQEEFEEI
jgi:DNA-directed RNA polymerase specialized sigma24 family protein